ncbi:SDR family NAD(P)-dependent oxidoreductase [Nocardioides salsibiostraticola]
MKNFANKTAAITGAGSGIGRALALSLAAQGCHLSLSDIDPHGLGETAALLADRDITVSTSVVDVADREQMKQWAVETIEHHGRVNLVFNNAGVAQSGTVVANSYEDYEWVLGINLWGVIHGTKEFLPHLLASGDGHIVNISSVFGLQSQPGVSTYNTSKFAVRGFTEALRQELDITAPGVSATCVHPGGIRTNIMKSSRFGESMADLFDDANTVRSAFEGMLVTSPDAAAEAILNGVRRNARRVLIGLDARFLDLEQRLLPTRYQSLNASGIDFFSDAFRRFPKLVPGAAGHR